MSGGEPEQVLQAMSARILHRGPDEEGRYTDVVSDGAVGLAIRRLAIIDLAGGQQPMSSDDGQVQIVFNGEIFNFQTLRTELQSRGHKFRTRSDTETVIRAYEEYGDDCVLHLRGMFAFAIWDGRTERLLLARDRFGQKPLFYTQLDDGLYFASETKAFDAIPRFRPAINDDALSDYLVYRYVPEPRTLLEGVHKLLPGHVAVWQRGALAIRSYFSPPDSYAPAARPQAYAPERFLEHLDEAVRIRLVSDVPFGAFLSGGIDSSMVVALMARHSTLPIKTYSVGFAEQQYSELVPARAVARRFETEHHELVVTYDDIVRELPTATRLRDAPVSEPSDVALHLLAREARRDVKMVLTGEGADEFLGGYPKHVAERYLSWLRFIPSGVRQAAGERVARRMPYRFDRLATALSALSLADEGDRFPRWFGAMQPSDSARLLSRDLSPGRKSWPPTDLDPTNSPLRRILHFDQVSWLPGNLLERGDRMTMGASLEARMPFLDHKLAEYVSSLPDSARVSGRTTKRVLRDAAVAILPPDIIERPKVGFKLPVSVWFQGPLRDFLTDHLTGVDSWVSDVLDRKGVALLLEEHLRGERNHEKALWTLLTLEIWHRECVRG